MNKDQFILILKYWKIKKYLIETLSYDEQAAKKTIAEIRKMKPEILHEFLVWFNSNSEELPNLTYNGITLKDIMELRAVDPISAFIDLNWVKVDPIKAKYLLGKPLGNYRVTEDEKEILRSIAKKRNWDFQEEDNEDVSDIKDPIK